MVRSPSGGSRESGQAAVESALTLPLVVFLILGTLQLFMLFHGRILTQLAAFAATRAGSVAHGNCDRMVDAALIQVMPAIEAFARPGIPSAGANLAAAFSTRRNNRYNETVSDGGNVNAYTGSIIWIVRQWPLAAAVQGMADGEDKDFDEPVGQTIGSQRLEVRLIFWYPMRIPFANWVLSKMFLVNFRLQSYTAQNPLMQTQTANWTPATSGTYSLDAAIGAEMLNRAARNEYVFPITASYTMRMMTPAKAVNFATQNCPPTPAAL